MKWTPALFRVLTAKREEGKSLPEIALEMGITRETVRGALRRAGVPPKRRVGKAPRQKKPPRLKLTPGSGDADAARQQVERNGQKWPSVLSVDQKMLAITLAAAGWRPSAITAMLGGVSKNVVIGFLYRVGMLKRPAPSPETQAPEHVLPEQGKCMWSGSDCRKRPYADGFCSNEAILASEGRVWCAEHRKRIYQRVFVIRKLSKPKDLGYKPSQMEL
jgi:hypothetical protein